MLRAGADNLKAGAKTINDLNVFPIPDGDTGDNMFLTILGGANAVDGHAGTLSETARSAADGMLLSARGNSGVILSQFFDGIAAGLEGVYEADNETLGRALRLGVEHAYGAVVEPAEGTILTVARCAAESVCEGSFENADELLADFISAAKRTLDRTPDMLPVLKKAGVVDSGGAGLICIMEGMKSALSDGCTHDEGTAQGYTPATSVDISKFTEDSVLELGYCTEVLLRLQRAKTDPENFDVNIIIDFLKEIGNSVVAFRTGSIVKLHVHTETPDRVLAFCRKYGEFLTVKIENMSLQHNSIEEHTEKNEKPRKSYGVVAVCSGDGVKKLFKERGADAVIDGGQSSNPSTEDLIRAFEEVNADTILVFPNNSNIILTAEQAGRMYGGSDVRVVHSKSIGDGYAALSMLDTDSGDTDGIVRSLEEAMADVVTSEVSRCVRDTEKTRAGDYIGFSGKDIVADNPDRTACLLETVKRSGLDTHDICILIYGRDVGGQEAESAAADIRNTSRGKELYVIDGMQEVYDYIVITE